ncbi:MAG: 23S rRNA (uracil(1939)-C(5))-methyltransferase RlmD [Pseudohongiellaceae bacterium]
MSKRRHRRQKLPQEPVELTIESVSHEGRGVAHREGKVAFVDGALLGENVSAQFVRKRSKFDEFKTVEVLSKSQERVEPPCRFTGQCGGCSLQHWSSEKQILFKQSVLLEQLAHATGSGSRDFELLEPLLGPTLNYRRKARLGVRLVEKKGGVLVGFREKYSSFITEMDHCSILIKEVAELIAPLRELIGQLEGSRNIPQIEVAAGDMPGAQVGSGLNQVALVFRHLEELSASDESQLVEFSVANNIQLYLQPGGNDSVHKVYPREGSDRLQYALPEEGLELHFHPMDFTQINAEINRAIVSQALDKLALQPEDTVLDLFCGLGNFTLAIAKRCKSVIGVEGSEEMVVRGYENAKANQVDNVEFFAANLAESMANKSWSTGVFNKVLLDPPRSGAAEIIEEVAALKAQKIVYVSCNPSTLARDTASLIGLGYRLVSAGVMDMFPHTTHVESMAEFELVSE